MNRSFVLFLSLLLTGGLFWASAAADSKPETLTIPTKLLPTFVERSKEDLALERRIVSVLKSLKKTLILEQTRGV